MVKSTTFRNDLRHDIVMNSPPLMVRPSVFMMTNPHLKHPFSPCDAETLHKWHGLHWHLGNWLGMSSRPRPYNQQPNAPWHQAIHCGGGPETDPHNLHGRHVLNVIIEHAFCVVMNFNHETQHRQFC